MSAAPTFRPEFWGTRRLRVGPVCASRAAALKWFARNARYIVADPSIQSGSGRERFIASDDPQTYLNQIGPERA